MSTHRISLRASTTSPLLLAMVTLCACPGLGVDDTGGDDATGTSETATAGTADETAGACSGGEWSAPDWETNAASALALRAQLDLLTGDATMRGAESGAVMIGAVADLDAAWAGEPSLASVANPGYVPIVEASFAEFVSVLAAGEVDLVDDMGAWTPGPDGGIWGDDRRGINEGGLEVRQLVDKGGYSAGILYAYALSLTEADIEPATVDAIAAAWGNNAQLDPEAELTDSAGYSYQMGFHADMAEALTVAKAHAQDPECAAERDAALVTFFELWEQTMLARTVFYGNRAEGKLLTAATDTELADVLHDLAEGIGVAAGFIGLPDPQSGPLSGRGRIISDAQVTAVMDAFGVDLGDLGVSTTGQLVQSLPDLEAAVGAAEAVVMEVYGVDAATIMTYAMPTPG